MSSFCGPPAPARPPRPRRRENFPGEILRRRGGRRGRARLQHRHDGLPGNPDRPLLPGADGHHDLPPHRELRDHRGGGRVAPPLGGGLHREGGLPAAEQLPGGKGPRRVFAGKSIPGVEGIDTRALTRHIRERGALKAVLSSTDLDEKRMVQRAKESPA